jgi:hypothetical protein
MAQSINDFKNSFFGGTRKNRFRLSGTFPNGEWNDFLVSAAALPQAATLTNVFDHRGRKLLVPGDRIYGSQPGGTNWNVVVLDDNEQNSNPLWSKLHSWSSSINNHELNTGTQTNPVNYKRDGWTIEQLDLDCSTVLKSMTLYGCWPFMVGPIDLNMSLNDEYVTFNATFAFDYYVVNGI